MTDLVIENDGVPIEDVLPRYKETNPRNYDELTLARKRTELKAMIAHYKDMSPAWLEMCWDFVENTPKDRIDEIINNKEFEGKPTKERDYKGGVIKGSIDVRTRTPEELMLREQGLMPELNEIGFKWDNELDNSGNDLK
tara:strand:- start:286 stop:702 length:417 start_codon:yes stop_codon:yes gene_type:complete